MLCYIIIIITPSQDVRPSIRPSATRRYSVETVLHKSSNFLHSRVAISFLFVHTKRDGNIPTGTLLTRAPNARVYENRDFRPICLYLGNDTR